MEYFYHPRKVPHPLPRQSSQHHHWGNWFLTSLPTLRSCFLLSFLHSELLGTGTFVILDARCRGCFRFLCSSVICSFLCSIAFSLNIFLMNNIWVDDDFWFGGLKLLLLKKYFCQLFLMGRCLGVKLLPYHSVISTFQFIRHCQIVLLFYTPLTVCKNLPFSKQFSIDISFKLL